MSDFDRRLADLADLADTAGGAARLQLAATLRRRGHRRVVRRRAAGGMLLATMLVGACAIAVNNRADNPSPPPPGPANSSPTPEPSPSPASTPSSTPSASSVGGCRLDQLLITIGNGKQEDAASGHRSIPLLLRNIGSTSCSMRGYPKVVTQDSGANTVAEARQTPNGFMGGLSSGQPPTVTLAPGQTASALFETMAFNPGDGSSCKPYALLRVTPPEQPDSAAVPWGLSGCAAPEIHPIVPGSSGRS